jgi:hypothetical protein
MSAQVQASGLPLHLAEGGNGNRKDRDAGSNTAASTQLLEMHVV